MTWLTQLTRLTRLTQLTQLTPNTDADTEHMYGLSSKVVTDLGLGPYSVSVSVFRIYGFKWDLIRIPYCIRIP